MDRLDMLALAERLDRMIAEPAWLIFYMNKDEAAICAAALRSRANLNDKSGEGDNG